MPPILDHPPRMPLWDAVSRSGGGWRSGWGNALPRLSMPLKRLLVRAVRKPETASNDIYIVLILRNSSRKPR